MTRLLLLSLCLATAASAQDWQVVWADEFDTDGAPDATKWDYDIGGHGWGNSERQYYTDRAENVRVENGVLVIEAKEEAYQGNAYTSARLVTRGKAAWKYGRIEARMKLPYGQGIWPAFWMLPTDSPYGGWPMSGEIDIMEYLGHDTDTAYGTLHYGGGELGHRYTGTHFTLPTGAFPDAFHTFAIEWAPRQIRWYIDGELYQTQVSWTSESGPYPAPFDQPFHLLLNLAVGGEWPGYPDATTVFPQQMLVDYVRVYQDVAAAPTVSLDAPAEDTAVPAGSTVALAATATDGGTIDEVVFLQSGGVIGTDTEPPYALDVAGVVDGCYAVSARATDTEGYTTETAPVAVTVGGGCPDGQASPFLMVPAGIPGVIEAEHFDLGGPNVAYRDLGAANTGVGIRQDEGVDLDPSRDEGGGFDVVDITAREWLSYSVDVAAAGTYRVTARLASATGARFRLSLDGQDLFGEIEAAATGGSLRYGTALLGLVELPEGRHTLRFDALSAGLALNKLGFLTFRGGTAADDAPADGGLGLRVSPNPTMGRAEVRFALARPGPVGASVVDVTGRRVRVLASGPHAAGPHMLSADLSGLAPGVYAVVVETGEGRQAQPLTVLR